MIRTLTERVVGQNDASTRNEKEDVDKREEGAFYARMHGCKSVELFASAQPIILGAMVEGLCQRPEE